MIRLFGKIKQRMLANKQFGKYLFYAFGEVLIVITGILIAVQLNNWNESRKLAKTESIYLKRFRSEIKMDTMYISRIIKTFETRNKIIEDFSAALNNEDSQDSILMSLTNDFFRGGWFMGTFAPSTSTFDDLSNTGNLNIISNTSLRDDIVELYQQYSATQKAFKVNHDWITPIDAMLTGQYSGLKYDSTTSFLYPSQSFNERVNELRKDREIYIRNASNHYWSNNSSMGILRGLKGQCAEILQKFEIELTQPS